jgi:RHS repeat-associated protein
MKPVGMFMMPPAGRNTSRPPGESDSSRAGSSVISRGKGQQFEYAHDSIGNRTQAKAGGDQSGTGLRSANYSANALNQYTQRDVPGVADTCPVRYCGVPRRLDDSHGWQFSEPWEAPWPAISRGEGVADLGQTVTVNGQSTYRKGGYFQIPLAVNNATIPAYSMVEVQATQSGTNAASQSGHVFLPQTPEQFHYDADGNLTNDGHWNYTWDADNRLVSMETISLVPVEAKRKLVFEYDWQGRRIAKKVYDWDAAQSTFNPQPSTAHLFLYDSWNLLVELTSDLRPLASFLRGLDLSGSLQGAGGIGGLVQVTTYNPQTTPDFVSYDGNGNVTTLVDANSGSASARYEYGPFGEPIRMTGLQSHANPFGWSTKHADEETDLVYYGYRYYSASLGRWINRDPKGETDGVNVHAFIGNNCLNAIDPWGWDLVGVTFASSFADRNAGVFLLTSNQIAQIVGWDRVNAVNPDWNVFSVDTEAVAPFLPILTLSDCVDPGDDLTAFEPPATAAGLINNQFTGSGDTLSGAELATKLITEPAKELGIQYAGGPILGFTGHGVGQILRGRSKRLLAGAEARAAGLLGKKAACFAKRAIDLGFDYEKRIRALYPQSSYAQRRFTAIVDGKEVSGIADTIAGRTAVEAKYVDNWATSNQNPLSPVASKEFAVAMRAQLVQQARAYSQAFERVLYHTNSPEFLAYYTQMFRDLGLNNITITLTR